ncbi:hypothetical protein WICMUC_002892 [Wickerhamomyces mucosus]|uniref:Zn(2)-C6 fungal-type domain-containing protein n=1 Tax=Wickerhamomyces mucosus TaxID=1378264 RepID=A0A9P8PP51_9ASCO|nr:hypothetical protein WICMUC_002892 [Wickerhamomyces mucosus]
MDSRSKLSISSITSPNDTESPSDQKQARKRIRVPTSCSVCRKKKIKCNKKKPICTACSKSELGHLCHYEKQVWESNPVSTTSSNNSSKDLSSKDHTETFDIESLTPQAQRVFEELTTKIQKLESSISNQADNIPFKDVSSSTLFKNDINGFPYIPESLEQQKQRRQNTNNINDTILRFGKPYPLNFSFHFNYNEKIDIYDYEPIIIRKGRFEHNGPFSLPTALRHDPFLKVIWLNLWKDMEITDKEEKGKVKDPVVIQALKSNGKLLMEFLELRKQKTRNRLISKQLRESDIPLIEKAVQYLPGRRTIMNLLFRFFRYLYPFFPLVHENTFLIELDSMITLGFTDTKVTKIEIKYKHSYATLGLLLVLLRLSYTSLSEEDLEQEEWQILKRHPIESPTIEIAKQCLECYNYVRKSYFHHVLILALFLKIYYRYSPEDDDISDQSGNHIRLGLLFSMAYSIGMNRNPLMLTHFKNIDKKKDLSQIYRKTWYKLIELDCTQTVFFGTPLQCVDNRSYDIPLPIPDIRDDKTDTWIIQDYHLMEEKNQLFRETSNTLLNLHSSPSVLEIFKLNKKLENFIHFKIGSVREILNSNELQAFAKIKKISYLFELKTALLTLNNYLLLHFDRTLNVRYSLTYLSECLAISLDMQNTLGNLIFNEREYFNSSHFTFFMRPLAIMSINKITIIYAIFNSRLMHTKENTTDVERLALINQLSVVLHKNMEFCIQLVTKLGHGYYNTIRNTVLAIKFCNIQSENFNFSSANELENNKKDDDPLFHHLVDSVSPKLQNYVSNFTNDELKHLAIILEYETISVFKPMKLDDESSHQDITETDINFFFQSDQQELNIDFNQLGELRDLFDSPEDYSLFSDYMGGLNGTFD